MSLALWRALTAAIERLEADPEVGYFTGWPMMLSECAHHACYLVPSAVSGAAQRCPSLTGHSISRLFAAAHLYRCEASSLPAACGVPSSLLGRTCEKSTRL